MLGLGQAYNKTIQCVRQRDLTCEARVAPRLRHNAQHVFFGRAACSYALGPIRINIDVAGRAGTVAATISVDTRHTVIGGRTHERCAGGHVDRMRAPRKGDKVTLGMQRNPETVQLELSHLSGLLCGQQ